MNDDITFIMADCDIERVKNLIDTGYDVNTITDDVSPTLLHQAADYRCVEIMELLIRKGADVNAMSENGESGTPLHHTVSARIAECLISNGADIDAQDSYGHTPLHEAAIDGNLEVAVTLINHGADIDIRNHSGWTPLHWAVWKQHRDIVRFLISHGADVNAGTVGEVCTTGWTPEYWMKSGPLKDAGETKVRTGWTPLHLAAIQGDAGIAVDLLDAGANPNVKADSLCTPLHWAKSMGNKKVEEILISHGGTDDCDSES